MYDVTVNIYQANGYPFTIYHSGVEVKNVEYSFSPFGGIYQTSPKKNTRLYTYYESQFVGITYLETFEIKGVMSQMKEQFNSTSYSLFSNNCNHFSDILCKRLTGGAGIPAYINRISWWVSWLSCIVPEPTHLSQHPPNQEEPSNRSLCSIESLPGILGQSSMGQSYMGQSFMGQPSSAAGYPAVIDRGIPLEEEEDLIISNHCCTGGVEKEEEEGGSKDETEKWEGGVITATMSSYAPPRSLFSSNQPNNRSVEIQRNDSLPVVNVIGPIEDSPKLFCPKSPAEETDMTSFDFLSSDRRFERGTSSSSLAIRWLPNDLDEDDI